MTNKHKAKGDRAELEIAKRLTDILGIPIRRKLGAGRHDDTGDLDGLFNWTLQVKNRKDIARTIREGLPQLETQRTNARTTHAAMLCRMQGGTWIVVLSLDQWTNMLKHSNHHQTQQQIAPLAMPTQHHPPLDQPPTP